MHDPLEQDLHLPLVPNQPLEVYDKPSFQEPYFAVPSLPPWFGNDVVTTNAMEINLHQNMADVATAHAYDQSFDSQTLDTAGVKDDSAHVSNISARVRPPVAVRPHHSTM